MIFPGEPIKQGAVIVSLSVLLCAYLSFSYWRWSRLFAPLRLTPKVVTEPVRYDADDPAIWVNHKDPSKSLILGTDKGRKGSLSVFSLSGRELSNKTVRGLKAPNNVDVEYGFGLGGKEVDIAVVTERGTHSMRIFSLPELTPLDGGGIPLFEGDVMRDPTGVAIYKRRNDNEVFVIVSRSQGPTDGYLWQYLLADNGNGEIRATKVRAFGRWGGVNEIESIAVDDELGYVYYSDESIGIRKYYADPGHPDAAKELAMFGGEEFANEREGIAIYPTSKTSGYILVSDQQADRFHVYPREGSKHNPHLHSLIKSIPTSAIESDGSDATNVPLGSDFPEGLFVAMSDDRTFQLYSWKDMGIRDTRRQ